MSNRCDECKQKIDMRKGATYSKGRHLCVPCDDRLRAEYMAAPAEPVIKWVGGKRQLMDEIRKYVPASFGTYFEPFVGGAAVFFALRPQRAVLSDLNDNLITMYRVVRDDMKNLGWQLTNGDYTSDEKNYYRIRARNMKGPDVQRAADFLYLNKFGFNGMYRENRNGEFNVPYGKNPDAEIDLDNLRRSSEALQGVTLITEPFQAVLENAREGDFVYFDPPYVPVSATSDFTGYQGEGFDASAQIRLRDIASVLHQRRVHVLLSNSAAPAVFDLYRDFRIAIVKARRSVNSDATKRGPVDEVLIRPPSRWEYAFA